ncbi:MAG: tetratricopeptide repeat protein [Chloroflexota bacterium]
MTIAENLTPNKILNFQIERMLAYWIEETRHIDADSLKKLDFEKHNLFRAVQIGLRHKRAGAETAVILCQAVPFVAQRGYWKDWIPLLEQSLRDARVHFPEKQVPLMINLGRAYQLDRQLDKAIAIHLEAEKRVDKRLDTQLWTQIQHDLLEDYYFDKQFTQAKAAGLAAIERLKEKGESTTLLANCYKMMGSVSFELGEYTQSETYFDQAIASWRLLNSPIHLARTLNDKSRLLIANERLTEAEICLTEAERLLAPTMSELDKCMIQINLGSVFASQQKWKKAETAFRKTNSPYLRQSINIASKAKITNNLGYVLFMQMKYELAEGFLHQSLSYCQETGDELEYANTLSNLINCYHVRGKKEAVLPLYNDLFQILAKYPDNLFAQRLYKKYREKYKTQQVKKK